MSQAELTKLLAITTKQTVVKDYTFAYTEEKALQVLGNEQEANRRETGMHNEHEQEATRHVIEERKQ